MGHKMEDEYESDLEEEYEETEFSRFMKDYPLGLGLQPYLYEPRVGDPTPTISSDYSDEWTSESDEDESDVYDDDDEDSSPERGERLGNTTWCKCSNCVSTTSAKECQCCEETAEILVKMKENEGGPLTCITLHKGFIANCLDRDVIEVSFWHHVQRKGPFDDDHPVDKLFQKVAYQRFATWIWKLLRKRNRKILPSCVVTAIKAAFPSDPVDFKYPKIP